jgi:hypothetical protein
MNRKTLTALPVMAVMAVGVSACGGDEEAATAKDEAASAPKVAFTSPGAGDSVGSKFTAKVDISGFQIDAKDVGKKAVDGRGHLHFSLDGGKYDSAKFSGANGKLAEQLGTDGKYSPSVAPTITYNNIPKGKHVLKVYVANNDHSESGAVATRTITVG